MSHADVLSDVIAAPVQVNQADVLFDVIAVRCPGESGGLIMSRHCCTLSMLTSSSRAVHVSPVDVLSDVIAAPVQADVLPDVIAARCQC